jgi:hypothetical protein
LITSNLYVCSKSRIVAAIIVLLTIFTFEQQQLYAYFFSDFKDNNFNHISTNVTERDTPNVSTADQDKKTVKLASIDTPDRDEDIPNSTDSNSNGTSIVDNKKNNRYTSEGCSSGYGYEVGDENPICEPLSQSKEDNQTVFCEALGCPYNPPSPYVS